MICDLCREAMGPPEMDTEAKSPPLKDGLSVTLQAAKEQMKWFEDEIKKGDKTEVTLQYFRGSRDAYSYMIDAINETNR